MLCVVRLRFMALNRRGCPRVVAADTKLVWMWQRKQVVVIAEVVSVQLDFGTQVWRLTELWAVSG